MALAQPMQEATMESKQRPDTPLKAIKTFCVECFGGNAREVSRCTSYNCPLYEFRQGKNPKLKRELTDEQRQQLSISFKERMAKSKENIRRDA